MNVLVINGPNLNLLGKRPKEHYGTKTLDDINALMKNAAKGSAIILDFYQSNYEGDIVTKIQEAVLGKYDAIIINPAAYTHTSVAIHDALEMFKGEKIEVHLSHVDEREDFRKVNFVRSVCTATFAGKLEGSYVDAVEYLKAKL
ncbi:MAG: 3-dehydroquinate dehydratase [Acholeplasmatales bacterium]|nr:3-dehydroquinate dehydratase [Acholeplasmatales bacterium]